MHAQEEVKRSVHVYYYYAQDITPSKHGYAEMY